MSLRRHHQTMKIRTDWSCETVCKGNCLRCIPGKEIDAKGLTRKNLMAEAGKMFTVSKLINIVQYIYLRTGGRKAEKGSRCKSGAIASL